MSDYVAPLQEIRFVLGELADIDRVAQIPEADSLADPELTEAILAQAARFAEEVLAPLNLVGDSQGLQWSEDGVKTPDGYAEAYRQFIEAEWNTLALPADHGGQGLPMLLSTAVREMFVAANKAFCMLPELTSTAVEALIRAADESLKSQYVPNLVSGKWSATMNLTEPQAGSDVGALRTRAVPQADGSYRLFGQKIFISFGEQDLTENIVHLVLARTPDAPPGSRGISLFLVPKVLPGSPARRNDVVCAGIEHKLGNHGSPTCTLVYGGGGEGALGWLVGQENKGLQHMFVMMNAARFNVGLEGVALSERAYQQALAYARERVQGKPAEGGEESVAIIHHPDVRRMLMSMRSQTEAMRALAYLIASAQDLAERHPDAETRRERQAFVELMIPVFKGWATETAVEVTRTSIQVHGGTGYILESGASQPLRDVLICPIYEGTTGIQANDFVSRKVVRDNGAALRTWLEQMKATLAELEGSKQSGLVDIERELGKGIAALEQAAGWIIAEYPQRQLEVLAGAVPFLNLAGIVAGGWQMARAALKAQRSLVSGRGNASFLRAKVASARFYATHVLPQAPGLAHTVLFGGDAALALDENAAP
ncbi:MULTISPECIES: acyl-CoA dehydrogenase [Pseudomonas aeruginosa group]|uniref:3-methylmercaptopropionyl-CoA dehydrogenase n=1 Tax=Pseudomonas nitroreducens TaxID=46680 RepID=A0A6G6ISN1_PSENT|nr:MULTISPECIES: acyl-CoA dehydrogenase [Pseudomonas aeruginosa group]KYO75112.1 Acyl-CoA dehydrogenase [Pseudomonas aeruginosa]QIE86002.1 acyl-CoA dehydrogenase [Pseudomonas nitroreducens]HCE6396347.1 acyl-CoA dehydrogenase [Pseudomonas aeruginosa]